MNGVKQKKLVESLARMAAKCCSYIGDRCDCKFMDESIPADRIMTGSETGSGCPELSVLAYMIAAMTDQEYNSICQRASITISEDFTETIDAKAILKKHRKVRQEKLCPTPKEKK